MNSEGSELRRPCCMCGQMLDAAIDDGDWKGLQPHGGGEIQLIFGYGSTKFDRQLEGTVFKGIICDNCAEKLIPNMFLASESAHPVHAEPGEFNCTLPVSFVDYRNAAEGK